MFCSSCFLFVSFYSFAVSLDSENNFTPRNKFSWCMKKHFSSAPLHLAFFYSKKAAHQAAELALVQELPLEPR